MGRVKGKVMQGNSGVPASDDGLIPWPDTPLETAPDGSLSARGRPVGAGVVHDKHGHQLSDEQGNRLAVEGDSE
jgi:hypothetical protein